MKKINHVASVQRAPLFIVNVADVSDICQFREVLVRAHRSQCKQNSEHRGRHFHVLESRHLQNEISSDESNLRSARLREVDIQYQKYSSDMVFLKKRKELAGV